MVLLNADIRGEHDAIVHYLTHSWTVAEVYGSRIESIARDEMRHLKWLAHTVVYLQGVPDFSPREAEPVLSPNEALDIDIAAENQAIAQYEDHLARLGDPKVEALISRILIDERDHRRQFQEMAAEAPETLRAEGGKDKPTAAVAQDLQQILSFEYRQILEYLFRYFVGVHGRAMGMTDEDRAVDEMKHMGWVAESMAFVGQFPRWQKAPGDRLSPAGRDEQQVYARVLAWSEQEAPDVAPLLRRIIAHEEYQVRTMQTEPWTVGSLKDQEG